MSIFPNKNFQQAYEVLVKDLNSKDSPVIAQIKRNAPKNGKK